ncbi:helix-turn-helix transcriptional regulator [Kribbella sp. NPDC050820]|uniref:helix-turn-helix domain-containing protein n=1 Tax=Kribbella sp. NPDC050820 TaxID=3155408 RepID=UPI0033E23855
MTTQPTIGATVSRIQLGRHLQELRERAKLSLRKVAEELEVSAAKWSRVENGETSVRSLDVAHACRIFGVADDELVHSLMDLAKQTKAKSWLDSYADVVSEHFAMYIELEAAASQLTWYETDLVPGLLQTREYASGIMAIERFTGTELDAADLERRLQVRLTRQKILTRESGAPVLRVVLGEAALHRRIGGPTTMAGQLAHLLKTARLGNVEIRLMPLEREHAGLTTGPFIVLDFPPRGNGRLIEPSTVYIDGYAGFLYLQEPEQVELYQAVWTNVWDTALTARQSIDCIKQRLKELQQVG